MCFKLARDTIAKSLRGMLPMIALGLTVGAALGQPAGNAPTIPNHVLELDGTVGYAEMPPNIFNDLDQATVEAWVRWDDLGQTFVRLVGSESERRPERACPSVG